MKVFALASLFSSVFCFRPSKILKSPSSKSNLLSSRKQNSDDAYIWDFDSIYLITTFSGSERLARTRRELENVNLWSKVQLRTFKTDDDDRVRGCYTSHIKVLEEADRNHGYKNDYKILVLEDNLETTSTISSSVIQSVNLFLQNEPLWDVFHLAYMMYVPGLSLSKLPNSNSGNECVNIYLSFFFFSFYFLHLPYILLQITRAQILSG